MRHQLLSQRPHFNNNEKFIHDLQNMSDLRNSLEKANKQRIVILNLAKKQPREVEQQVQNLLEIDRRDLKVK